MPSDVHLTGITAAPATIAPGGGVSTLTPVYTNAAQTDTITGVDENGNQAQVVVTIQETLALAVVAEPLPAKAPAGQIVFGNGNTALGTLAVATGGTTLTFTAS